MRFNRLTIRDYRGVGEATVEFAASGITLVHGPNEAGKSSLAEAVTTLFKYKSSTTKVKHIKPVDKDAGPVVELEATSGDYHFTYAKRFLKRNSTTLTVHRPAAESLTGDMAHERVEAILRATLRKELWDALFSQKKDVDLLQAEGNAALMRAVDTAAGGGEGDDPSEGIYERVTEYYHRFFYKNHRESSEIAGAKKRLEQATAAVAELEESLRRLDEKTERSTALRKERVAVASELATAKRDREEKQRVVDEVAELKKAADFAVQVLAAARAERTAADTAWRERKSLVDAVEAALDDVKRADEAVAACGSSEPFEQALRAAEDTFRTAESAKKDADDRAALARRDCDYCRDVAALADVQARAARLRAAHRDAAEAQQELDGNVVTGAALRAVRDAAAKVEQLKAVLTRDAPRVVITGLGEVEVTVDGEALRLAEAEEREYSVADSLSVTLPNALRLDVRSGSAVESERKTLAEAVERFTALLQAAGCATVEEAEARADQRRGTESALADARRRIDAEPPEAALLDRIGDMETALARYVEARGDVPLPDSLEAAVQARSHAESALLSADDALTTARAQERAARQRHDAALQAGREAVLRRDMAGKALAAASEALDRARETAADEAVEAERDAKEAALTAAQDAAEKTEKGWKSRNPEDEAEHLLALRGRVAALEERLQKIDGDQRDLAGELRALGEAGLAETLGAARAEQEAAKLLFDSVQARANAAKLLYETMTAARERIRQNYQRPLKAMLEELGRDVFGPGFQVAINDALAIESRTVDTVTVPFADLSGGAKEQLLLLYRAACAILVSEEEGMPLILDDVLGHSDTERLHLVGKALETAAERCQIIIFTCMPDRYAGLRGVKTVELGGQGMDAPALS
ncbi:MAG: AAA family ATPase [Planctomycetaceae bacterium]|nr:AAA family ATPase [Planctomycetaceae bacterium]